MTIQKKSLLSSLNTTKKAIVASSSAPNQDNPHVNAPIAARVNAKIRAKVIAKVNAKIVAKARARARAF